MANKKTEKAGAAETLLVELLTEELPPKALLRLSRAFSEALVADLRQDSLLAEDAPAKAFATPRRLAVSIPNVLAKAPDKVIEILGPSVSAGSGAAGGFARKHGIAVEELKQIDSPKGKIFACTKRAAGTHLETNLALKVEEALKRLPVPKTMRWGGGEAQFVRPVHGLVMLHGPRVVSGEVLGSESSNKTLGHRFLADGAITVKHADDYEGALSGAGRVIADFAARRSEIAKQLEKAAGGAELVVNDALLDEVTALVEAPAVYQGTFSADFLTVPEECLILSMQQHQKYVPLRDKATGRLLARFLFVSNIPAKDPGAIIHGNERVLRARLSDAKFFYDQDRKTRLDARVPRLANVVYHRKLGSQLQRVERIRALAGKIAPAIDADSGLANRAAELSKADLITEMVGEFPELQGIMGRYYALHDGEPAAVANAIGDQYQTRRGADAMDPVSSSLYLADRIEQLTGLFGIGERPTGEKDPYALRRAALGVINAFELLGAAGKLSGRGMMDVKELLEYAAGLYSPGSMAPDTVSAVHDFVLDRYRNQLATIFARDEVEAVLGQRPPLADAVPRVQAVAEFRRLPEADSLAAASKRARNILRKEKFSAVRAPSPELLVEDAEKDLARAIVDVRGKIDAHFDRRQFVDCLSTLAGMRPKVDTFFDKVLVNAEDPKIRENRLALLSELDYLFNRVADISKLAA
jgi:glycyl-tRNA synthetase beta chain